MKKGIFNLIILSLIIIFTSCEVEEKAPKVNNNPPEITKTDDIVYMVPTPNELFSIIKEINISYDNQVLNSPDNIDNYTNKKVQSLNFGVYTADLAFAGSFNDPIKTAEYFKVVKDMGDLLKINSALDQTVFDQIDKNIQSNNQDELYKLRDTTYYQAYVYLKENKRGPSLALIVLGGWIESLYIMTQLGQYEEGSVLMSRITDQKYTLENLYGFMQDYEQDADVMEMMQTLEAIDEVFLGLNESIGDEFSNSKEQDVQLMDGGPEVYMTEEDFNELKKRVAELRTKIVKSDL